MSSSSIDTLSPSSVPAAHLPLQFPIQNLACAAARQPVSPSLPRNRGISKFLSWFARCLSVNINKQHCLRISQRTNLFTRDWRGEGGGGGECLVYKVQKADVDPLTEQCQWYAFALLRKEVTCIQTYAVATVSLFWNFFLDQGIFNFVKRLFFLDWRNIKMDLRIFFSVLSIVYSGIVQTGKILQRDPCFVSLSLE